MNTARLKAWIGYTLAVEEVERRLGLSWGAAQKALLEACERGELRWRNTPGGGPDIGDPDLFDWLEAKRSHPPSFKQSRILKIEFRMRVLGVKFTDGIEVVRSQAQTAAA